MRYQEEAAARATCGVALPARFPREMAPQPVAAPSCPPSPAELWLRKPQMERVGGPRLRRGRDPSSTASWHSEPRRVEVWVSEARLGTPPCGSRAQTTCSGVPAPARPRPGLPGMTQEPFIGPWLPLVPQWERSGRPRLVTGRR